MAGPVGRVAHSSVAGSPRVAGPPPTQPTGCDVLARLVHSIWVIAQQNPASSRAAATAMIVRRLARASRRCPGAVQSLLGAPGDRDRLGGLAVLAVGERLADAWARAVVPGGLDQQPAGVPGAGLGDRPEPALLPGRVLAWDQPDVAHQLLGAGEPLEVADLGAQPDRGQRVDAAQAPQPADLHAPTASRAASRRSRARARRGGARARRSRRCASSSVACAAGQSERRSSPATRGGARVHACPSSNRIPWRSSSFESRCRQRIRSIRTASRARTRSRSASSSAPGTRTACSLPASSNRTRCSASRRSVLTRSPAARGILLGAATTHSTPRPRELARQPVAGRPGLIRDPHRPRQPRAEPGRLGDLAAHREHLQLARLGVEHRRDDLRRVHIQTDEGSSLRHGWFLLCGCGPPRGCQPRGMNITPRPSWGNRPLLHRRPDGPSIHIV